MLQKSLRGSVYKLINWTRRRLRSIKEAFKLIREPLKKRFSWQWIRSQFIKSLKLFIPIVEWVLNSYGEAYIADWFCESFFRCLHLFIGRAAEIQVMRNWYGADEQKYAQCVLKRLWLPANHISVKGKQNLTSLYLALTWR